jgi:CHAT domain-containing protein
MRQGNASRICLWRGAHRLATTRGIVVLSVLIGATGPAIALTKEAAIEHCRMTVGKPIVMACMQASGGRAALEECRAKAHPKVVACVMAALNAANGRANVAVAVPTEAAPKPQAGATPAAGFIAPPRTISDVTAILDNEKPDLKTIETLKEDASAEPTGKESRADLAQFYFDRANARAQLGRLADSTADVNKAIEAGAGAVTPHLMGRLMQLASAQYIAAGEPKKALEILQRMAREINNQPGAKGLQFATNRQIISILVQMADIPQAEGYLRRSLAGIQEARTSGLPRWRATYDKFGQGWEADIEFGRGIILEARGQYAEAEAAYHSAELRKRASVKAILDSDDPPSESLLLQAIDGTVLNQARMKAKQGRLEEAEVDARRALLSRLKDTGKYNAGTPRYVTGLASILVEQGRYAEAEQLARVAIEIAKTFGVAEESPSSVQLLSQLGSILTMERKREAVEIYGRIDKAIAGWEPRQRQIYELNPSRILALYASGQLDAGIAAAERLVANLTARVGEAHFDTASAHGWLAIGLRRAGRDADATREFKLAIPGMMAAARENADDDSSLKTARSQRLQVVVEAYLAMLAEARDPAADVGEETFGLADAVRGQTVQQALAASSARAAARDPALAELVRKEQDLSKQLNAQLGTLTNALSLSSEERDEKAIQAINASIAGLKAHRQKARQEIVRRFPACIVTNGALGLLPLSLLPIAPAEAKVDDDPLFASYRDVPWLARSHAVATIPSAAALRTLRQLPPGRPDRDVIIGFGDPYFSKDQEAEAEQEVPAPQDATTKVADADSNVRRGVPLKRRSSPKLDGVDSAELALLPRLPDTAEELKSIALALQADPSKVLYLGKNASESAVKTMNLSGFKVLAFATHGLVPGELNGLTQPALALSSPSVTGENADGLLTMEEILGLKLDADWVVLSACNTGAGAGGGAEAASGLGRAFFYAGTRALLVTNWSVHSQSARQLVTDLFKRQADNMKLGRSEALRQAMMALVDGPGYLNAEGKTEFSYAHPLFWAPYTIIGDGAR